MPTPTPKFCRIKEAATVLGVNPATVRRMYLRGELMGRRAGTVILILIADLERAGFAKR